MTGRGPGRRSSLARRTAAACLLVAMVAVGVAALASLRLVSVTAREVTRDVLAQQADVVAAQLTSGDGPVRGTVGLRRVVDVLQGQDITVALLGRGRPAGDVATILERAGADRATRGEVVSAVVEVDGSVWLVEARPTDSGAFALLRTSDAGLLGSGLIRRNLGFSLLTGAVVALVVGTGVGRLLARPLRRTAAAAHELRGGRRDVRIPVEGPSEVAEVAATVNELADALAQRGAATGVPAVGLARAAHAADGGTG